MIVIGTLGAWCCLAGPYHSTIGHLGFSYLLVAGLAAAANLLVQSRKVAVAWLGFSLVYVPFSVGACDSLGTIANSAIETTEVKTESEVIAGRILRMTSGYAILFDGKAMNVIPLNKIRAMRRVYAKSPELDYLGNMMPSPGGG
jgi:hypothetical protein